MALPSTRAELLKRLQSSPDPQGIAELLDALEREQPADLSRDRALLRGVWELLWSSSSQPWLKQAPWLDNLQVLDPDGGRGMNLLRLKGPLGSLAAISVLADLEIQDAQRIGVRFRRGGWIGPSLLARRLELLVPVRQEFQAWLDITVLDRELRVCRGNAGTRFVLRRRHDLQPEQLLPAS